METDYTWHEAVPPTRDLPHVSQFEGERVVRFGAWLLTMLRLSNWRVDLAASPCDEDNIAHVDITEGRHVATVYLSSSWMEESEEVRLNCVIHEIMHVVHYRLTHHMYAHLEKGGYVPDAAREVMWEGTRIEAEYLADHLAGAFSQWENVRNAYLVDLPRILKKERKAAKKRSKKKGDDGANSAGASQ